MKWLDLGLVREKTLSCRPGGMAGWEARTVTAEVANLLYFDIRKAIPDMRNSRASAINQTIHDELRTA